MAKFKPVRKKSGSAAVPGGGLPCLIMVAGGLVLVMLFLYFVMKYSS